MISLCTTRMNSIKRMSPCTTVACILMSFTSQSKFVRLQSIRSTGVDVYPNDASTQSTNKRVFTGRYELQQMYTILASYILSSITLSRSLIRSSTQYIALTYMHTYTYFMYRISHIMQDIHVDSQPLCSY
jgi:hypothetical protein